MKTHGQRTHKFAPRNETYLLIRSPQMRKPHYDCRDFADCLDAPELVPSGAHDACIRRSEQADIAAAIAKAGGAA